MRLTAAEERPHGSAARLDHPPVLDGDVAGDPAWRGLVPFTGFRPELQPDNGAPASQRTEVYSRRVGPLPGGTPPTRYMSA